MRVEHHLMLIHCSIPGADILNSDMNWTYYQQMVLYGGGGVLYNVRCIVYSVQYRVVQYKVCTVLLYQWTLTSAAERDTDW